MPRYIIYQSQIAGLADPGVSEASLPGSDWAIVESELTGNIKYDPASKEIVLVNEENTEEPPDTVSVKPLNWIGLESDLRASEVWGKAYHAAGESLKAGRAFSLMLATITATHNTQDLLFALTELQTSMTDSGVTLAPDDIEYLDMVLEDNGFDIRLGVSDATP